MNSQTIYLHFSDKRDMRIGVSDNGNVLLSAETAALDFCCFISRELAEELYQQLGNTLGAGDERRG
jgi:hypothetical protein